MGKPMTPKPVAGVERGDHVYVQHPKRGAMAVKVLAHGRDGFTGEGDGGERHKLGWDAYVGHKKRVLSRYSVVDQGADGALLEDDAGERRYLKGEIPVKGAPAAENSPENFDTPVPDETPESAPKGRGTSDDPLTGGMGRLSQRNRTCDLRGTDAPRLSKSEDLAMSEKPLGFAKARVLFMKSMGQPVANRPGLALKRVTDKVGHSTQRWSKTNPDQPAGPRQAKGEQPGAVKPTPEQPAPAASSGGDAPLKHGDHVSFRHGDVEGSGKIVASGADGVTVHDGQREHQVRHDAITGKAPEAASVKPSGLPDSDELAAGRAKGQVIPGKHGMMRVERNKHGKLAVHNASPASVKPRGLPDMAGVSGARVGERGVHYVPDNARGHRQLAGVLDKHVAAMDEATGATVPKAGGAAPGKPAQQADAISGDAGAGATAGGGGEGGGGGTVPPERFDAHSYAALHNDPHVTAADILKQFPADTAGKIDDVNKKLVGLPQTIDTFKKDGKYLPTRRKVHEDIIGHFLSAERVAAARPAPGELPTFKILGGRGGSGKSWFEGQVYEPDKAIVMDADAIKKMLPEYEGWNACLTHEESGDLFDQITEMARAEGLNIVHDATMKTGKKAVALVKGFKDSGYRVEAHYMYLPPQEAAKRAVERFLGPTKRFVPPGIVLGNTTNEGSFDEVKQLADAWSFRDNNVARGEQPRLISESKSDGTDQGQPGRHGLPAARPGDGDHGVGKADGQHGGGPAGKGFAKALKIPGGQDRGGIADRAVLFFKAAIPGGAGGDLFGAMVSVAGHTTRSGTYVAPYQATRHKAPEPTPAAARHGSAKSGLTNGEAAAAARDVIGWHKGQARTGAPLSHAAQVFSWLHTQDREHSEADQAAIVGHMGRMAASASSAAPAVRTGNDGASLSYSSAPPAAAPPKGKHVMMSREERNVAAGSRKDRGPAAQSGMELVDDAARKAESARLIAEFEVRHAAAMAQYGELAKGLTLFFKAAIPGGAHHDLFASSVQVKGHTSAAGTYVAPYQATRHKAPELVPAPARPAPVIHHPRLAVWLTPWILDVPPDVAGMLGDMERCLAWALIEADHGLPRMN